MLRDASEKEFLIFNIKSFFLMKLNVVKNVNTLICVLLNDVNCDIDIF